MSDITIRTVPAVIARPFLAWHLANLYLVLVWQAQEATKHDL